MGPEGIVALIEWHHRYTGKRPTRINLPADKFHSLARECQRLTKYPNDVNVEFASSEFTILGVVIGKSKYFATTWEIIQDIPQSKDG